MTNSNLVDKIKSTVETTFDMKFDDVYSFEDLSTSVKTINHEAPDNAGNIDIEFPKQVQADLTQNDESALDHVKGRTHWSTLNSIEILPSMFFEIEEGFQSTLNQKVELEIGKTYTVLFNNAYIQCVATSVSLEGDPIALGNLTKYGYNIGVGYGFGILVYPDNRVTIDWYNATSDDVTTGMSNYLGVYDNNEIVNKLDNKYLNLDWIPTNTREMLLSSCPSVADYGIPFLTTGMIHKDQSLIVYWDGIRYECVVSTIAGYSESEFLFIGNRSFCNGKDTVTETYENTGEPFLLEVGKASTYSVYHDLKFHSISVYTIEENKLPDNYIPDDIVRVVDDGKALVIKSSTVDSTKIFKITVDDSGTLSATPV